MSERITFVLPDGTLDKLKNKAEKLGHTQSSFGRKALLDAIKDCEHLFVPCKLNGQIITDELYTGPAKSICTKCGLMPFAV